MAATGHQGPRRTEKADDGQGHARNGPPRRRLKIAIVGTGLAGLNAAYLLSRPGEDVEVHLFERSDSLGLDSHSINVQGQRMDVPMRSVNSGYYANLMKLYRHLGISLRKSDFTYSFALQRQFRKPFLLYNGMNGIRGVSVPAHGEQHASSSSMATQCASLFQRARLLLLLIVSYLSLLVLALYHHLCGHLLDPHHRLASEPLHEWLKRYPRWIDPTFFTENVLYATLSAVTTSSYDHVKELPTSEALLYVATTFARSHYTVQGGVETVQRALTQHIAAQNIHLRCTVEQIARDQSEDSVSRSTIVATISDNDGADSTAQRRTSFGGFDDVILACPAHLSSKLIQTYVESTDRERQDPSDRLVAIQRCLSMVPFEHTTVINHRDASLMPQNPSHWRDLNLVVDVCPSTGNRQMRSTHLVLPREKPDAAASSPPPMLFQTTCMVTSSTWPAADSVLSRSTIVRALTPSDSKQTLSGLFAWQATRSEATLLQRVRMLATLSKEADLLTIESDWLTRLASLVTRRRFQLSLGHLHRQHRHAEKQDASPPDPSVWVCGSYAQGIPLLEGCVTSSTLIVREILQRRQTNGELQ